MDHHHDERLWTPWRMRYITGGTREDGCIFCNRVERDDDVSSLIILRGEFCFIIMNLYPYNTGHVMIVPNQHADDLAQLDNATLHEMTDLLPITTNALRRVLRCEGFNIGFNLGAVAGAGVAAHLHQHIVPRWLGDANFLPLIGSTTALPELIPATYAKIRAEIARELAANDPREEHVSLVLLTDDDRTVLLENGRLPRITVDAETSLWRGALNHVSAFATELEIAGWAGPNRADDIHAAPAFVARGSRRPDATLPDGVRFVPLASVLDTEDRALLDRGFAQVAPRIAPPTAIDEVGDRS